MVRTIYVDFVYLYVVLKFVSLIFLFFAVFSFSQEKKNVFNLLLTAGLSPAQVHGDDYSGFHKIGIIGGIGIESIFAEKISGNLFILFIQKGAKKNPNPTKGDYNSYYLNLNYLEVPVVLTYTQKKYILDVGISAAYLINYYEGTQYGNQTGAYPFLKFDYSLKIGLGYNINEKLFVNFRSSNSFVTIRPNANMKFIYYNNIIARTFNKGYYNNILEFTLGYRIKPHKKNVDKT